MGIKQVEKLYKKMVAFKSVESGQGTLDAGVRSEIFQMIMDDVERLLKKLKKCKHGTKARRELDLEIRHLLLKEIQVIIDDYIISQKNGNLKHWKEMYGDINHYIKNYYTYREENASEDSNKSEHMYGLYDSEHLL